MARRRAYPRPLCSPDEGQALYDLQGGRCAICGRDNVELLRQALPYRKCGRKVIFLRHEVEAYLNGMPGLQLRHISL
jgi:hypothetical protein